MMNRVEMNEEMMAQVNGGDGLEKGVEIANEVVKEVFFGNILRPIDWAHRLINHVLD